ncbi:hypothetical protein GGX14DRAFT_576831 [Mycena pura]|uniref:Uncharacterized protein n=1 Tax=Mycena pura TaxID=153505 RepID=A0AAD6UUN3_9AGAR|nr:hypothetical protein GGX14DRAFT_576831 [Mycena pura]
MCPRTLHMRSLEVHVHRVSVHILSIPAPVPAPCHPRSLHAPVATYAPCSVRRPPPRRVDALSPTLAACRAVPAPAPCTRIHAAPRPPRARMRGCPRLRSLDARMPTYLPCAPPRSLHAPYTLCTCPPAVPAPPRSLQAPVLAARARTRRARAHAVRTVAVLTRCARVCPHRAYAPCPRPRRTRVPTHPPCAPPRSLHAPVRAVPVCARRTRRARAHPPCPRMPAPDRAHPPCVPPAFVVRARDRAHPLCPRPRAPAPAACARVRCMHPCPCPPVVRAPRSLHVHVPTRRRMPTPAYVPLLHAPCPRRARVRAVPGARQCPGPVHSGNGVPRAIKTDGNTLRGLH